MRLGFYMGYAQPGTNPLELLELAREAEGLGYDSAWAAEAWGVDAITPLAWLGAQTTTLKLGTAIMQLPGRSPANAAMTAVTLDMLSDGRFLMGLGTSGPQGVEGWHGDAWARPRRAARGGSRSRRCGSTSRSSAPSSGASGSSTTASTTTSRYEAGRGSE